MKTVLFINTTGISDEVLKTFILCVSSFKDIKCELSAFDVERRSSSKPVLATIINNYIQTTDLFQFSDISTFMSEGYNVVNAESLENYSKKLANDFQYC